LKFRVLPAAARDIEDLRAYIAADDAAAAEIVSRRLNKAILLLVENPNVGRPIGGGKIREWTVPGLRYLIPYRVEGNVVIILRVWHTRRDKPKRW
jgi:plasmid stabilization system protein ParE